MSGGLESFAALLEKALDPVLDQRYQTADEMWIALRELPSLYHDAPSIHLALHILKRWTGKNWITASNHNKIASAIRRPLHEWQHTAKKTALDYLRSLTADDRESAEGLIEEVNAAITRAERALGEVAPGSTAQSDEVAGQKKPQDPDPDG